MYVAKATVVAFRTSMRRLPRLLLSSAVGLSIATAAFAVPVPSAPPSWPQAHSDLSADPGVRFGVLPNGMRYAVMRNATPAGQTSLRLRIGSGSLEENDAQQGLAHVLEHMAFKGSTHVPAGEMVKILQRKGLAFGPDTNAETEWTQTVYMLDLPKSDVDTVATGLMLMRETASELAIDEKALATERGVVLSEERLRDTPRYRAQKAQIGLFLDGQRAASRYPIGQVDVIQHSPASLVRQFYEANYRPERATLIAVGDFDTAEMESRIKAGFSDWKAAAPATPEPDLGQVAVRGLTAKVVELPGSSTQVVIAWARPYDDRADTAAKEVDETIEELGLAVLNRRLATLAQSAKPPFLGAGAEFENLFHSDKVAVIQAVSAPDSWRPALDAALQEVRRLTAYGVEQGELDREITEMRTRLTTALAGAATRPTPELAQGLIEAVDEDEVFTAPAEDLALFERAVKGLKSERVNAALAAVFAGQGPLVELASPAPVKGGDVTLKAAYAAAAAASLSAPSAQAAIVWPYRSFGTPGRAIDRKEVADLGLVTVRFANGVGLTVKPTHLRDDQVLVAVNFGAGRLGLPSDRPSEAWTSGAFIPGGYGKISFEDSQRALAGKTYGASFSIGDDTFALGGATRPTDLGAQLQVLTAYVADPGFRPEAFERLRNAYLTQLPQLDATPDGVFARDSGSLFASGDTRWGFPRLEDLSNAKPQDLRAVLGEALSHGPLEVTIVGDIDVDRAIALTAATFGALPDRPMKFDPRPGAQIVHFPAARTEPVARTDTGRADQAIAVVAWPTTDFFADTKRSRAAMLAGEVLQNRLLDKVRSAEGLTYSPETRVDLSQTFPGYGYAFALVEMPPAKIPGFYQTVDSITADMRENGVTADELARARNPRIAGIRKAQLTNEYWIADLSGSLSDPRHLELIRSTFPDYESVTPADVQQAARDYLTDDKAWRLVIKADPKVASAAPVGPS
jgi:zinc protease